MKDGAQFLPGRLVVSLLVAGFDGHDPLGDDPPPLDEPFFVEVVAPVEDVAEVNLDVVERDQGDGLEEAPGGLGHPAGHGHGPDGVGLLLHTGTDGREGSGPNHGSGMGRFKGVLTGALKLVPSAWARARHTSTAFSSTAFRVISW